MGKSDGFKSIKVISFNGNQENYREWISKTVSIGESNGWWDQIQDKKEALFKIKRNNTNSDEKEMMSKEKEA